MAFKCWKRFRSPSYDKAGILLWEADGGNFEGKCGSVSSQWSDKVRFYANTKDKTLITSEKKDLGKGWCLVRVGKFAEKQRGRCDVSRVLTNHYPDYKEVSVFSEESYHAPKSGKVTKYGQAGFKKRVETTGGVGSGIKGHTAGKGGDFRGKEPDEAEYQYVMALLKKGFTMQDVRDAMAKRNQLKN